MINNKTVLAIIPARGGSKGVPRKNIRDLAGKPLIAWTIEEAKKSNYIDRLILSSEDAEIIQVAKRWGCEVPFVRPSELAQDDTPGIEPVLHAIYTLPEKYDFVVLLQPTSPLRTVADIDGCIEKCINEKANSCVSVAISEKSPYWMYNLNSDSTITPFVKTVEKHVRRQDLPQVYALNGAVYVAESGWLSEFKSFISDNTIGWVMPCNRSLDIDSENDLILLNYIIK